MTLEINAIQQPFAIGLPDNLLASVTWASAVVRGARPLDENAFADAVRLAYEELRAEIHSIDAGLHVVRLWNHIPGITETITHGRDRYMAFNAGRFAAMCDWYGGADRLIASAPAASGVGHGGDDLLVIAMAARQPGVAVQNPLQIPAVDYSARFGRRPPCFARATRLGSTLLVSGTAAIRGEESVAGDLRNQLDITLENLAALTPGGLADYRSLRVYLPDIDNQNAVSARLKDAFPGECAVTFMRAELCRRELLIEIEGVAGDSSGHGGAI